MTMRTALKSAAAELLVHSGLVGLSPVGRRYGGRRDLILTLHRVLPRPECETCYDRHMALSVEAFESLLILLKTRTKIVSLDTLLSGRSPESGVQEIALTFDDGWRDTYEHALPLLLRYDAPATVFLCTSLIGTSAMLPEERLSRVFAHCVAHAATPSFFRHLRTWGRDDTKAAHRDWRDFAKSLSLAGKLSLIAHLELVYGLERTRAERFMTWEQVKVLASHGIEIGSHTANHATLTAESRQSAREELTQSRDEIAARLGVAPRYLCYPNGRFSRSSEYLAAEVGYTHAFTTEHGRVLSRSTPYAIPRMGIDETVVCDHAGRFNAARLQFYLSSMYEFLRQGRQRSPAF